FKEVIAGNNMGDFWWGFLISISILLGALFSPIIGAIADYDKKRKRKLIIFTMLSVIGTASLYFTGSNTLFFASLVFIATNFFFEIALTIYNSLLPQVSTKETVGLISGFGWGLGYIGGIAAMLILQPLYAGGIENHLYKFTFPLTALFFLLFSIPAFISIKEDTETQTKKSILSLVGIGCSRVFNTIKDIKKYKDIAWFLLAFYFVNDALVTIFAFVPIYAKTTLSFTVSEITILLLLVQLIGFPATLFFGWLSDKKGSKKILLSTIFIWGMIVILLAVAQTKGLFYFAAISTGLVVGSSQSIARSWLSKIIPPEKEGEFFGFNGFASKISATTGPILFGTISVITANQRIAMISILPFFIISFIIFARIKEK
ncbi:MAG: MFS transporter, partial [Patescibacteria group bacterium]